ncbi:MAG: cytochrome C [Gammaproteobacteria bacterium]|nr:cytochrome C [Gammaproteobacteria bacterium]
MRWTRLLLLGAGLMLWAAGAWAENRIERLVMPGALVQSHAKYEDQCEKCHEFLSKKAQTGLCRTCHDKIDADIKAHKGFHGRIDDVDTMECRRCHTDHIGRKGDIVLLDEGTFVHSKTDFELEGAHQHVKCAECHESGKPRREAPHDCYSCHRKVDAHDGKLGKKCGDCHDAKAWLEARDKFDHDKTKFPLKTKHRDAACASCHPAQRYKDIPRDCHACHKLNDAHGGRYDEKCEKCHKEEGWKKLVFDHTKDTKYPLEGKHEDVACDSCHPGRMYHDKAKTDCHGCHEKDDDHRGRNGANCKSCHRPEGWDKVKFNHDTDTKWPLRGRHEQVDCNACHKPESDPKKTPHECFGCHEHDDRHEGRFGKKCETCHRVESWQVLHFDHNKDTKYPLFGRHALAKCESCHTGGVYDKKKLGKLCNDCHETDDPHKGKQGKECDHCHQLTGWTDVRFDHDLTRFPLIGLHAAQPCESCHATPAYKDTPQKCGECHKNDDVHGGRLGKACGDCHNPNDWKLWDFDHNKRTKYKLDGRHAGLSCTACHTTLVEDRIRLAKDCYGCHEADDVHHEVFGKACDQCHTTQSFKKADVRR